MIYLKHNNGHNYNIPCIIDFFEWDIEGLRLYVCVLMYNMFWVMKINVQHYTHYAIKQETIKSMHSN